MLILKDLDPSDAKAMRAYRLQVKERLYKFNYVSVKITRYRAILRSECTGNSCTAGEVRKVAEIGRDIPECQRGLSANSSYGLTYLCIFIPWSALHANRDDVILFLIYKILIQ